MKETIAKLVQYGPIFSVEEKGNIIHDYFEENKESEGIVLVDGDKPVGLLMRNDFYQKIGRQFGYSLYMNRNIHLIMKNDIVCVDISCDMAQLGFIAMNRSKDNLYDFIVVMEDHKYLGVISIREFLIEMSKTKEREIKLLNKQQQILKEANEAEKLHSMEIEQKNASIKNLLNNAGQGFLSFGSDFIISVEHSKECNEIFKSPIGNRNFLKLLSCWMDLDLIRVMEEAFNNIFGEQNKTRNRIYLSILPKEMKVENHTIMMEYKTINPMSEKSIMVILTDITEKKALEMKYAEEKNNVKLVISSISHKTEISRALEDLKNFLNKEIIDILQNEKIVRSALYEVFRIIHTMKGDFSLYSLYNTSNELHRLEDELSSMVKEAEKLNKSDINEFINKLDYDQIVSKDVKAITDALGSHYFDEHDLITISENRLTVIEQQIKTKLRDDSQTVVLNLINSLKYTNLKNIIENYSDYIKAIAEKIGKGILTFSVLGDDVYVDKNKYSKFTKSLVHIFKNIVDHGIEKPDDRVDQAKPEFGEIICNIKALDNLLKIDITDDGGGIDSEKIRNRAIEKGIYTINTINTLSENDILDTIFKDGFSTKNDVNMLSGRGVGLAAVRREVENLGGTVKVHSEIGKYTRFEFYIPI